MSHAARPPSTQSRADAVNDVLHRVLWSGWWWAGVWVATRGFMLNVWHDKAQYITGDVFYYFGSLFRRPIQEVLPEYPLPVVWVMDLLRFASPGGDTPDGGGSYLVTFAIAMATLDAAYTALLWSTRRPVGAIVWIIFVVAQGSIIWWRYDMVPAFVVGLAVLWVTRRPAWSGGLVAAGAALKLWPALLIAPLIGRGEPPQRRMVAFGLTGGLLALFSYVAGGWARLISPLTWQSDRGLQIESVPATLAMWRAAHGGSYSIELSKYNAYEVSGAGTAAAISLSSVLMAAAVLHAAALAFAAWRRRNLPADWMGLAMIAVVATILVANKTLSPQYLVWFGAPVAAWLTLRHRSRDWPAWTLVAATIALAALTQAVYPLHYGEVVGALPSGVNLLVARNVLMIAVMVGTVAYTWIELFRPPRLPDPPPHATHATTTAKATQGNSAATTAAATKAAATKAAATKAGSHTAAPTTVSPSLTREVSSEVAPDHDAEPATLPSDSANAPASQTKAFRPEAPPRTPPDRKTLRDGDEAGA